MTITELLKFFLKEIDFKSWIKVLINFIFHFSIVISEILFLSTFFLILNEKTDSRIFNVFFSNLEKYFFKFFDSLSLTEIYIVILIFFLLIKNILMIAHNIYYNTFIFSLSVKKSAKILQSYISKSYEDFSKKEISIYIKQLVRDVENVFVGIFGLVVTFISELIYVLVLIFFVSNLVEFIPSLEVYLILIIMISILYVLYIAAKKYGELRGSTEITVFKTLTDTLNIFKEIKLVNNSKDFVNRYQKNLDKYFKTRVASGVINLSPKFMFEFFLLIFFFIIFKNEVSALSINEFVIKYSVFAIALLRLIPSFAKLSSYFSIILYNLKSVEFIKKDLSILSPTVKRKFSKKVNLNTIKLVNISLRYINKNNSKLSMGNKNLNLKLKKNKIYGIYGESGSGKTSILNILSGFVKPSSGTVLFNNKKYKSYDLCKKFEIGYASQTPTIIDENIIVNTTLKYSNSINTKNKIKKYLNILNLKKFDNKKYFENSVVSSIKNMSGGERQRIGLIRSLINDPKLILLDEPTSALDKKNEIKILKFLQSIKRNKIIVVTSHKEEHKKYFDQIINL